MIRPLLAAALLLLVAGPASAQRGRRGAASLPQVACAAGPPVATPFAAAAADALSRVMVVREEARAGLLATAAERARQGIAAAEANPYHHFLLGQAQIGLGNLAAADSALRRTVELCPEFAGEVRGVRWSAYQTLYNQGVVAFNAGDTAMAVSRWNASGALHDLMPEPFWNAGAVAAARGEHRRALELYRQALAAADRAVAAAPDSARLAELPELRGRTLVSMRISAVNLFSLDSLAAAGEALAELERLNPQDRLAAYVRAMILFRTERWEEVVAAATRVMELDPLTENVHLLLYNAQKQLAEQARARGDAAQEQRWRDQIVRTLSRLDSLPLLVADVGTGEDRLRGEIAPGPHPQTRAAPGTPHVLEVTLFGPSGPLPAVRVTVAAPAEGARTPFEVPFPVAGGEPVVVTGFRYRLVRP